MTLHPAHLRGMTTNQFPTSRVPAGVPAGGQFAASAKSPADVSLSASTMDPEHGDGFCGGCGQEWVADPDGSPEVKVHLDADGERDHDADADHAPYDEDEAGGLGLTTPYPNGRCPACGMGLDSIAKCFHVDCSNFDEDSLHADEGHTLSGEPVVFVPLAGLRRGDRIILDGVAGVVTSIDNDHKTTSIELDGDPDTIASYDNDTKVHRYLGDPHPMPDDLVHYTDPDEERTGWYRVDSFGIDEVALRSRTGKVYPVAVTDLASAPGQVFGPDRPAAAARAINDHENARIHAAANPWSETARERLEQTQRVRDQYAEYGDTFRG